MKNIINNLLNENNKLSLTRFIAVTAWISFLGVSFYLVSTGKEWSEYETFATFTAGGGAILRITDKYIGKKYNSKKGDQE